MGSIARKLRKNLDPNAVERAERSIVIKKALEKRRQAQLAQQAEAEQPPPDSAA